MQLFERPRIGWQTALGAAFLVLAALGCETEPPYATCALDIEVTSKRICAGDGDTSCVVYKHPHCVHDVCLSYFGKEPICSQACETEPTSPKCPDGGFCWTFSEEDDGKGGTVEKKFCVPKTLQ